MPTIPSSRYYVYMLMYPTQYPDRRLASRPFYIGKGSNNRVMNHFTEARKGCTCRKCETIRLIWHAGYKVAHRVIARTNNEQEAFSIESQQIQWYGRKHLCNQNNGHRTTSKQPPEYPRVHIDYQLYVGWVITIEELNADKQVVVVAFQGKTKRDVFDKWREYRNRQM